jgi:Cdc6-like AAA superfamily ATPase
VLVNCTGLRKAVDFYRQVAEMLGCVGRSRRDVVGFATAEGPRVALVLDEVDYLSQRLLYDVFELPTLPATRLAVVGIANRLDLPLKVLPLLQATNRAPRVVTFRPYTAAELTAIVHARLADAGVDADLHAVAISLAAKKVASMSGDARRMLDVCREAMLALEAGDDVSAIGAVSQILARGGRSSAAADTVRTLPVQHQLALCCVANEEKRMAAAAATVRGGSAAALAGRAATVGGLYESFKSTCAKTSIPCIGLSDFADLLESLAGTHGLLDISAKGKRKRKRTAFGPAAGELRGKFVRLDSVSIADIQTGCRETPLLRLLVGTEG